ncbi:amidoligase family protein [Sediminimonas qiaohouensis]|uniref:amidoligase family protein n=1 Tax=Sediminimonas qiaohouensis TaxID=552061 RepID=UPI0004038F4D|nr:amidoligase family protein [Sediminimonas qiaohouensis]
MPDDPDFAPLPTPLNADGKPRKTGVEIELGGLSEACVAEVCTATLGGIATQGDGPFWTITQSSIGKIEVYLDIFLRKAERSALRDFALEIGREVIPVEIVTDPLDMNGLKALVGLCDALRHAGALGSEGGLLFGFGLHLNIEIASDRDADIVRPLLAYALIEDWMRSANPIDESRRVLPFSDPYPTDFVRGLIGLGPDATLTDVITLYLQRTPTRNRGLDMLPIFAHLRPDLVAHTLPKATSARPAFHFRLPDSRIDNPDWSIAQEWQRWITVERVAADTALLGALADAWLDDHGALTLLRQHWADRAGAILHRARLDDAGGVRPA